MLALYVADVDECVERGRCAENATCTNLDGSYDCNCSAAESHFCFGMFHLRGCHIHLSDHETGIGQRKGCSITDMGPIPTLVIGGDLI